MKWPLLLLMPFGAFGAIENIQLQGVTPTQATLFYTAPDEGACRIEVSEPASYAPLVHDVDPRLFAGTALPAGTILHNCRALKTILSTFSAAPSC
jgi:hypothetical protein